MPRYLRWCRPTPSRRPTARRAGPSSPACASCHTLFDEGGKIGPDLTGSQRANPEYVLTKLLAPSAVVAKDYLMTIVTTNDGRTVSGIVKEENDKVLVLQTATQEVRIAKSDIEERTLRRNR